MDGPAKGLASIALAALLGCASQQTKPVDHTQHATRPNRLAALLGVFLCCLPTTRCDSIPKSAISKANPIQDLIIFPPYRLGRCVAALRCASEERTLLRCGRSCGKLASALMS